MSQFDPLSKEMTNDEAIFKLIDVVFSLECCLHYQILPLELADNHLVLGMVNPKDKNTIREINPIISSLDYSFHIQAIDAHTHQLVLAAYLKRNTQDFSHQNSIKKSPPTTASVSTLIDLPEEKEPINNKPLNDSVTLFDLPKEEEPVNNQALNDSATLFDLPEEEEPVNNQALNDSATLFDLPEEQKATSSAADLHEKPTFIVSSNQIEIEEEKEQEQESPIFFSEPQINNIIENSNIALNINQQEHNFNLDFKPNNFFRPLESLQNLPPELLWQDLLARIVYKGIGRLYLQQHHNYGRILCSQDGVLKSSLDKVPFAIYDGVIKEIKMMAKLPLSKLRKPKKVALKRYYNHEKVLLRIEFIVGKFGEEVTIQVLRGQALKFYEERQVSKTLDHAIYLGQKLEKTLKKIRRCQDSGEISDLSGLRAIMQQVEKQLNLLDC